TCSHVALRHISAKEDFFTALDGVTFSIDDRNCLIINAPDFSFSPVVTNDIVDLIDNRQIRWLGRADNVIITGGKKVFPEDIERKISDAIEIGDFYITSRPSAKWGEEIILVTDDYDIDDNTLLARLRTALVSHERPKAVVKTHIDKTSSGKIIRRKFQ
ncbi:MAG: AMP-dependent synthetase, partial [Muribaculaceae bacterium]|nr:AMP-dependent synthetase [Muribaculaceae bacterium]